MNNLYSVITGTGSYIPSRQIKNEDFISNEFYDEDGEKYDKTNEEIIEKFHQISTIKERRYVRDDVSTSDIAYFAATEAIESSGIDKEKLDYIIVAHNFGDLKNGVKQVDLVPSIAARVKHKLKIKSPHTVAYDVPFGCPGWLQGMIQADYYIKSGDAKMILVIGSEILSRVTDEHDRDRMLYSDGAGAAILKAKESNDPVGILGHSTRSDTYTYSKMLYMAESYNPDKKDNGELYLKMKGRKLYQYALENVPTAIKNCLNKSNLHLDEIKKVLIHQANGKMDDAILKRLYKLYDIEDIEDNIMPMTVSWLGNSSVATIPTLLDLILKKKLQPHELTSQDTIIMASVGAGMNINALCYRMI